MDGKVKYRLVHLTFGPNESLSLDIGIFTPATGGPFPTLVSPSGTPPGATPLPRLAQGANQGRNEDALLVVGPLTGSAVRAARRSRAFAPADGGADCGNESGARARLCFCHVQQQRLRRRHHAAAARRKLGLPDYALLSRVSQLRLGPAARVGVGRVADCRLPRHRSLDRQEQADHYRRFAHGQSGTDCGRIRRSLGDGGAGGELRRRDSRVPV